jgi:hypothetical protein
MKKAFLGILATALTVFAVALSPIRQAITVGVGAGAMVSGATVGAAVGMGAALSKFRS